MPVDERNTMTRTITGIILAMALLAAACGSGTAVAGVASLEADATFEVIDVVADAAVDAEEAMLEYTECLRDEGMDVEDPEFDEDGSFRFGPVAADGGELDRDVFQEARVVCDIHLEGVAVGFDQEDRSEMEDTLVAYAACMRDNGYDMADPDLSRARGEPGEGVPGENESGGGGPFGDIDREDPAFQAADAVCRDITADGPLAGGFSGGGGGG